MNEWLGLSQVIGLCQGVGSLKNMELYSNLKFYVTFKERDNLGSKDGKTEDLKLLSPTDSFSKKLASVPQPLSEEKRGARLFERAILTYCFRYVNVKILLLNCAFCP